jgi:hypothetical protein
MEGKRVMQGWQFVRGMALSLVVLGATAGGVTAQETDYLGRPIYVPLDGVPSPPNQAGDERSEDALFPADRLDSAAASDAAGSNADGSATSCPCCQCKKPKCTCKKKQELAKKAQSAYKGVFYENDFSYLDDPCYDDWHLGEGLKRLRPLPGFTVDIGGEYRMRHHHEVHMRGLGLVNRNDDFVLHRTRLFANIDYDDFVRGFIEYLDASSNFERFTSRGIEVDRSDFLNLFGEVKLLELDEGGSIWARYGREELLYGAQRTASPLDWANTRRTFNAARIYYRGDDWHLDAFVSRPVFPDAHNFDNPDNSQHVVGAYAVYRGFEEETFDFYFLRYAEDQPTPVDFHFDTFGARWFAQHDNVLWEAEAAYQTGEYGEASVAAGFFVLGLGYAFLDLPWEPTIWCYYDWASGDRNIGAGYHHLFPLGHKYMGFMDLFGRRNLEDWNWQLTLKPHERLQFLAWFHVFHLQNGNDVPYTVLMTPAPGVTVPGGSQDLGQELDLLTTITLTDRSNLVLGFSYFWSGDFYQTNPSPDLFRGDAHFYYGQWMLQF